MVSLRIPNKRDRNNTILFVYSVVQKNKAERADITATLRSQLDHALKPLNDAQTQKPSSIELMPWIKNTPLEASSICRLARGLELRGSGGAYDLFLDAQGIQDQTLVFSGYDALARASFADAIAAAVTAWILHSTKPPAQGVTLETLFADRPWTPMEYPQDMSYEALTAHHAQVQTLPITVPKPPHIPADIKQSLSEPELTLFSLITLTDSEIATLKRDIGGSVAIYNWPSGDQPASQSDTFALFHSVAQKPRQVADEFRKAAYVLFIDSLYLTGTRRDPRVVVAKQLLAESGDDSESAFSTTHTITLSACSNPSALRACWARIWGVESTATKSSEFFQGLGMMELHHVSNPFVDGSHSSVDGICFVLCPATATEMRAIRAVLLDQRTRSDMHGFQFIQPLLPAQSDPDSLESSGSDSLDALMTWFDMPEYRKYHQDAPHVFMYVRQSGLDAMMRLYGRFSQDAGDVTTLKYGDEGGEAVYVAEAMMYTLERPGENVEGKEEWTVMIGYEEVGYKTGLCPLDELDVAIANLVTSNMYVFELIEEVESVLWRDYRGVEEVEDGIGDDM